MSNKDFFLHNYIEMIRSVIQGKLDEEVMASAIQNLEELFPPHQAYVAIFQLDQKQEHLIKLASSKLPAQLAKKDRSEEASSTMEQVAHSSNELAKLAEELAMIVDEFEL